MDRWEFCEVDTYWHRIIDFTPRGRKVTELKRDRNEGDRTDDDATARAITRLGLEGWELVNGSWGEGRSEKAFLFFKRRIPCS
jgi:hypothetical protein